MIVQANGLIVNVYGPYSANFSDSKILSSVMETDNLKKLFCVGDIFVVDRGFSRYFCGR